MERVNFDIAAVRRNKVVQLAGAGLRQVDIAGRVGITQARVSQILRDARKRPVLRLRMTLPSSAAAAA
jgi:predicted transcriptional regulator